MRIILKFVLKNIKEKKFRTFLIIFSIMISSALFFASSAISGTFQKMYVERMKKYYGTADIMIYGSDSSPTAFIYTAKAKKYMNQLDYVAGTIQTSGTYKYNQDETVSLSIQGITLDDLQRMNPIILYKDSGLEPFEGKKIIISKSTSEKYNLNIGDDIDLEINGSRYKFTVAGISQPVGPFIEDGQTSYGIVPVDALSSIYNVRGRVNNIYIKLKNPAQKHEMINILSEEYKRYIVREPITQEQLDRNSSGITTPFMAVTFIVLFMSVFIIYTSFKVITMERLPVIGTFRSIGATKKMTDIIMIAESVFYGVCGGILGCASGIGVLYVMSMLTAPDYMKGSKVAVQFTPFQLVCAFLIALILSLVSALLPIIKISKIPVKDIVLNSIEKTGKKKSGRFILGFIFLVVSLLLPPLLNNSIALAADIACLLLLLASAVLLLPFLTGIFVKILSNIYRLLFGNIGILSAKNLRDNKSILNNISLLTIGIASLLMINLISHSVLVEVSNLYTSSADFDMDMYVENADRGIINKLYSVEGISDVYGSFEITNVEIDGTNEKIGWLDGIDKTKYKNYWTIDMPGDSKALMEELDSGRNIILASNLRDRLNAKIGDTLTLKMNNGKRDYKVIGFMNTLLQNGDYALISDRYYKTDTGEKYFSDIFIKTSKNPDEVLQDVKNKFSRYDPWLMTMKQMEKNNMDSNEEMFNLLKGFSVMSLLIGIIGVLNNLLISFIERRRHLAMLRSIGMSKLQIIKMIFIEAFTGGLIGSTIGIVTTVLMMLDMPYFFRAADMPPIPIHYSFNILASTFISGMIIMLAASVSPAVKSSRLNIIETIKYE